ncbi:uncharacterized protein LOC122534691 [Frieseomelitta varia]|uniref:uncharacterized protein LOC122534691 n=1 Tax=Frieseomelitta varia TaxID=561572 RepID=UPI001CB6B676|nr:uncharacterized protein LOC122534691 [Frieseomelitta varia]
MRSSSPSKVVRVNQPSYAHRNNATFWTDSTIALHWINTQPSALKTFVANRIAEIREKTSPDQWKHVPTEYNPADGLFRGLSLVELAKQTIWQSGPSWLAQPKDNWPHLELKLPNTIPESRNNFCFKMEILPNQLLRRYSNFDKFTRIIAYCLRFRSPRPKGPLQPAELERAIKIIVKWLQEETFQRELCELRKNCKIHNKSKLLTLNPFLDSDGIIRIGGRLVQANQSYHATHPIVLPKSHHIVSLIIQSYHIKNLHAGAQTTLYSIRQRYWLLDGRNQVRRVVRSCIKCFRAAPPSTNYPKGDLPAVRVNEAPPFTNVGVDYCGPFYIKEKKIHARPQKEDKI